MTTGTGVLNLYDLARCHAAIESVERRSKPIADVLIPISLTLLGRLIDDVMRCAADAETSEIRVHVVYRDGVAACAFFRYEWCRAA